MRYGAVTLALNDEATIGATIKCLKDHVDYHIVLISERSYFGNVVDNGETEKICDKLGVEYIKGFWSLDHFQRTLGNKMCRKNGCEWVLTFDSDELMDESNINILKEDIKNTDKRALLCKPECYWKNTDYTLRPIPGYCPVIATRSDVDFTYIRNVNAECGMTRALMHHVSWAEPKDVYKKVTCYAHATDFNGEEWYLKNYKDWKKYDKVNLPDGIYDALYNPLPENLKCLYQT